MTTDREQPRDIRERLNRLEKQNRWLLGAVLSALVLGGLALLVWTSRRDRLSVAALVIASVSILLGPAQDPLKKRLGLRRTLEAEELTLLGPDGRWQVGLSAEADGPSLMLCSLGPTDVTGMFQLSLKPEGDALLSFIGKNGGFHLGTESGTLGLHLQGKGGLVRVEMSEEGPNASFYSAKGKGKVELEFTDNEPSITLSDLNGDSRMRLDVSNGTPTLRLMDPAGNVQAELASQGGHPTLSLQDADGKSEAQVSVGETGAGVWLFDKEGALRAVLSAGADGPELHLCNSEGEPQASLDTVDGASLWLFGANGRQTHLSPGETSHGATNR